jgi:alpha-beta hydrolase superfamily lysophospholipase
MSGPSYFGPEARRLFGWLSSPDGAASSGSGVVLCNPFGFEAICMHRAYRYFAEAFARAGFASLRFDYDGTGDSSGTDRDPDRVRAWLDSIHAAAAELRARTGVRDVYLFGVRLGATLAATAAAEREDYAGILGIVPVLAPGLYLRELEVFQEWGRFKKSPDGVTGIGKRDQEASGFILTASTIASLSAIDLAKQSKALGRKALVLYRDDRPGVCAWPDRLRALGVEVDARRLSGFRELNMDPHKSVLPEAMIAASVEWLETHAHATSARVGGHPAPDPSVREIEAEPGVIETAVFADARALFGIVSSPKDVKPNGRAVIILNAGAQHRLGPNRLWVSLARHWARLGVVVLRLDFSGLGDSRPRPGMREFAGYETPGALDIADAAAYLRETWGARTVEVMGLCSGGYHAIKAAAHGAAIDGVLSINQEAFFWDPHALEDVPTFKAVAETKRYREAALSFASWRKLFRGEVKVRAASRIFRKRLVEFAVNRGRHVARSLQIPLANDLATELRAVAKRRILLRFVLCEGEPVREMLFEQGGPIVEKLEQSGALIIETIAGPDHTFTPVWTHRLLTERLDRMLGFS